MAELIRPLSPRQEDKLYWPLMDEFRELMRADYNFELGYHGPPHENDVFERNLENRRTSLHAGIPLVEVGSKFRAGAGASGHDAGVWDWFKDPELQVKYDKGAEQYAQMLIALGLGRIGVDKFTSARIVSDIWPTKANVAITNWPEFNLCAADLRPTMLKDRTRMNQDTSILRGEFVVLKGIDLGSVGYKIFSLGLLANYHQVNLNFSRINEVEEFAEARRQMGRNLKGLFGDILVDSGEQAVDIAKRLAQPALDLLKLQRPPEISS